MEGIKGFFESKAVWGGVVGLISSAVGLGHYTFSASDTASAVEALTSVATGIGSLLAIYGRVAASKKIG